MDLDDPFAECWDRLDRAIVHRTEAAKAWAAWLGDEDDPAYEMSLTLEEDRPGVGRGTLRAWLCRPVPSNISILLGEYFYNLRAALDHAAYATAVIDNGWIDPPPEESLLEYPICESVDQWPNAARHIRSLSKRHQAWIEQFQPFREFEGVAEPRLRGIYWINELARLDRHRGLRVVGGYLAEILPIVHAMDGTTVVFDEPDGEVFVEDGTVLTSFTIDPWEHGDTVEINPQAAIDFEIRDFALGRPNEGTWLHMNMVRRLFLIESVVHTEVGRFEYDCMGRTRTEYVDKTWEGFRRDG